MRQLQKRKGSSTATFKTVNVRRQSLLINLHKCSDKKARVNNEIDPGE